MVYRRAAAKHRVGERMSDLGGGQEAGEQGRSGPGRDPRTRWRRRATTVLTLLAVFTAAYLIGQQVRWDKQNEVNPPTGAVRPDLLAVPGRRLPVPVTVTVYEDLRSPDSRAFALEYGPALDRMAATGQVRVLHRLVTGTDSRLGGRGSAAAANAAACAQDEGRFTEYLAELWRGQPDEGDDTFADARFLNDLAERVPGIDQARFHPCVRGGKHHGWVAASQRAFERSGLGTAPVLTVGGKAVRPSAGLTPGRLTTLVRAEVRRSGRDW